MAQDRVLRLGVAGLGRAFTLMLPTFVVDRRVELVAACDPRQEARAQFATDFGAPAYTSIEELAGDGAVDAIYVASPHQFHAEHTRTAADRGKHVLVEKPMALNLAECDAMIESCRHARVQLIVGHSHSFDTPYLKAREIVQSGELGAVKMIHALNYTDFLYRPRRPEELSINAGGGVVFSQAAHQIDVVRLLAASRVARVRAITGEWDKTRPTEGAYSALLWFECGAFASLVYSGYAHFDSDEWCGWIGEMGAAKNKDQYGAARARLLGVESAAEEARLKSAATYGGAGYQPVNVSLASRMHQHFGSIIVSCERGDVQPLPDSIVVYGNDRREVRALAPPAVPRFEVIDELYAAVVKDESPLHDGASARATLQVCLALLQSAREQRDIELAH
ncbi:MAG: Gfo/Idh/MocA family oxidoreductase [Pseudomonadota bacterium]|nr:Gfo/Idh/MocA family oxidoreductase [Pseudomonadota bacterium]